MRASGGKKIRFYCTPIRIRDYQPNSSSGDIRGQGKRLSLGYEILNVCGEAIKKQRRDSAFIVEVVGRTIDIPSIFRQCQYTEYVNKLWVWVEIDKNLDAWWHLILDSGWIREYRHPIFSKMFETAVTMGWKQLLQQPSTPYRTLIL